MEVIVSIGLLAMIAALGLFISVDFYRSYAFRSERSTIVSVLQKARSQSIDDIDAKRHGVHFFLDPANSNKLTYVIFECSSTCTTYPGSNTMDNAITASYNISLTAPTMPFDVIFEQLTGSCITSTGANVFKCDPTTQPISILDSGKTYNITVNSEGRIDW